MENVFRLRHRNELRIEEGNNLKIEKGNDQGEFYMSITNNWGDEEGIFIDKEETEKLVDFLKSHFNQ